jgi:hypothetical protein
MKSIYLPTSRNLQNEGTPVKICFEGKVTRGVLVDSDSNKNIVCVKTPDGKKHWSHETHVTMDNPEPKSHLRRWR